MKRGEHMTGKLLDVKQVQEMLGISERTIFRLIKIGDLTGFKAGREWRFTEEDIETYIAKQREKAQQGKKEESAA
ncbi:MAG: helix-turn-helix domain-containing protein [Ktedonobacteraceae bacterium]